MTKDEAIKLIKEYATRIKPFYEPKRTDYAQAIDMAIESLSADKYVPHKACFNCMERGTGMCKGTIQEQSWCPHVADIPNNAVQGGWIPVSEKLPKTGKQVLCCDSQLRVFTSALTEIASNGMVFFGQHCKVIAWMPLPAPYREDGE